MSLSALRVAALMEIALLAAGASPDVPATAGLSSAMGSAIISEITANAVVPGPTFIAPSSGGALTGQSTVTNLDGPRLKVPLKAALIAAGAADIQMTDDLASGIANAMVDEIEGFAVCPPNGLTSTNTPAAPGAVTGTGTITSVNPLRLALPIANALVAAGAASSLETALLGLALATAVLGEILAFAAVVPPAPPALVAPAGGGPLVGALGVS